MPARKFVIHGRVIQADTGDSLPALMVRAVSVDRQPKEAVFAETKTDKRGEFTFAFTNLDLQAHFPDGALPAEPLFFEVYQADFLLEATREAVTWQMPDAGESGTSRLVIPVTFPDETFIVRGQVVQADGSPIAPPAMVRAFNQGVAAEELLGNTPTRLDGTYEIRYQRSQLEPGQERANLVVRVSRPLPIGRPLVSSPLILNALPEEVVNLAVGEETFRGVSQFTRLRRQLEPEMPAGDLDNLTGRDLLLLAQKTSLPEETVSHVVRALQLAQQTGADAAVFFGLFQKNSPTELPALLAAGRAEQRRQLTAAVADNVVDRAILDRLETIEEDLQNLVVDEMLRTPPDERHQVALSGIFAQTDLDSDQQRAFLQAWLDKEGSARQFWTDISNNGDFDLVDIEAVQTALQLGTLSLNHRPMFEVLARRSDISGARDLAGLEIEDWLEPVGDMEPPAEITGDTLAERQRQYAQVMKGLITEFFPTATLMSRWRQRSDLAPAGLETFLENNPDFEFQDTTVRQYLATNPGALAGIPDSETLVRDLEGMDRLFKAIPGADKFAPMSALWADNVRSTLTITRQGEEAFIRRFEEALGRDQSEAIYVTARHRTAATMALMVRFSPLFAGYSPYAVGSWANPPLPDGLPDWETLFGSLDFCACRHCRSILSPAAYFADLLQFMERANAGQQTGLQALTDQRPDLVHIQLSCENTTTPLPYIDLVNEILENAVVNGAFSLSTGNVPQTTVPAEALRANPEHILPAAYDILAESEATWTLPFNLWHEERTTYLHHLGLQLDELMETFHREGQSPEEIDRATAYLHMTLAERGIITGESGDHGLSTGDDLLPMLQRSGLSYSDLLSLLEARFVNPEAKEVEFTGDTCALENATLDLTGAERDQLHRFRRLQQIARWTVFELDLAIQLLGNGQIDNNFLIDLSYTRRLRERFRLPLPELLSWWVDIPTRGIPDEQSWFEQLFLNTTVNNPLNPADEIFALNDARTELASPTAHTFFDAEGELDPEITPLVLAAINVTAEELRLLVEQTLSEDAVNLGNLSHLYRLASTARALKLSASDYLRLLNMMGVTAVAPSGNVPARQVPPRATWNFIQQVERLLAGGFRIAELDYILAHRFTPSFALPITNEAAIIVLQGLQTELGKLAPALTEMSRDELETLLVEKVALVVPDAGAAAAIVLGDSPLPEEEQAAIIEQQFTFLADPNEAVENLIGENSLTDLQERIRFILEPLLRFLAETVVIQRLAGDLNLNVGVCDRLLRRHLPHPQNENRPALAVFLDQPGFIQNPAEISDLESYANAHAVLQKLAKLALVFDRLNIQSTELDFLFEAGPQMGWIDMQQLPVESTGASDEVRLDGWLRLIQVMELNRSLFPGQSSIMLFLAAIHNGTFDLERAVAELAALTGWAEDSIRFLVGENGYALEFPGDFQDERWLVRLQQAFSFINKAGVTAAHIWAWNTPEATPDQARNIRNAAKARYDAEQWLSIAPDLSDRLRLKRRDALQAFLIAERHEFQDSDDLYERFLIDTAMEPCFMTSRIKQAIASVQLFVQRALMGLEPDVHFQSDDVEQWQWRKNYRVWEANRKVFMYPENFTRPELRDDKTPFFSALEDRLLQQDVTGRAVEEAYMGYLRRLDRVARLEIMAHYYDILEDVLHIFARTAAEPAEYYYRQWVRQSTFTPWVKMEINIEGEHLVPIIYNRRLRLMWVIFSTESKEVNDRVKKYHRMFLHWSEYQDGAWSSPGKSKVSISTETTEGNYAFQYGPESRFYFWAEVVGEHLNLFPFYHHGEVYSALEEVAAFRPYHHVQINRFFRFEGCHDGPVVVRADSLFDDPETFPNVHRRRVLPYRVPKAYFSHNQKFRQDKPLNMFSQVMVDSDGVILLEQSKVENIILSQSSDRFYVTPPHQYEHYESQAPFFFEDAARTFLVVPKDIYSSGGGGPGAEAAERVSLNKDALELSFLHGLRASVLPAVSPPATGRIMALADISRDTEQVYTRTNENSVINRALITAGEDALPGLVQARLIALPDGAVGGAAGGAAGAAGGLAGNQIPGATKKAYHFKPFYHPGSCLFIERLNRYGVDGLLKTTVSHPVKDVNYHAGGAYSQYNWEIFFHIPLLIANKLAQNQRFAEAQAWYHTIFDPTAPEDEELHPEERHRRYWKFKPFYEFSAETRLEEMMALINEGDPDLENQVVQWEANPFNPHQVARLRIVSYMKQVVMNYIDNLVAWGDYLFNQDTMEAINEATQLYVLAGQILGRRPEQVQQREPAARTFNQLALDVFSNSLVFLESTMFFATGSLVGPQLELNLEGFTNGNARKIATRQREPDNGIIALADMFHMLSPSVITPTPPGDAPLQVLYFCIPPNDRLFEYWDLVADRLFKIRNCMNIEGVTRTLALFEPPIDPALLVKAVAAGMDIHSALNDLNAPLPHYRFNNMVQKALELCQDVRALGNALLQALEKKDAEAVALLRAGHEAELLRRLKRTRELQIEEAGEQVVALQKAQKIAEAKRDYYSSRDFLNVGESIQLANLLQAQMYQLVAGSFNTAASVMAMLPNFSLGGSVSLTIGSEISTSVGVSFGTSFGGSNIAAGIRAIGEYASMIAANHQSLATQAGLLGGYRRRAEEWAFQAELARKELDHIVQQEIAARVRQQIAERELATHEVQMEHARVIDEFMQNKYTGLALYDWMISQISGLYFQSYQLAYDTAKRAEQCFRHELGQENTGLIEFGYWDSLKKGLLAGERLYLDIRRMEAAFLDQNRREYEITQHFSLLMLNPEALIRLRETGTGEFDLPELAFDLVYPGQYMRRIKSVRLTVPCVTGPYTNVSARLTLLGNRARVGTGASGGYAYQGIEDGRFRHDLAGIQSIAASTGRDDNGLFEFSFRDERYLPFEGAGAIGRWRIELPAEFRPFDYDTITDVILSVSYTAREGGDAFRESVNNHLSRAINHWLDELADTGQGLQRWFSFRREFAAELHQLQHPAPQAAPATELRLERRHFLSFLGNRALQITNITVILKQPEGETVAITDLDLRLNDTEGEGWFNFLAPADGAGLNANMFALSHTLEVEGFQCTIAVDGEFPGVEDIWFLVEYVVGEA